MEINQKELNHNNFEDKEIVYGPEITAEREYASWTKLEEYYARAVCLLLVVAAFLGSLVFTSLLVLSSTTRVIAILYLIWTYVDRDTPDNGGRKLRFLRKLTFWRPRRDYFPVRLVKTADLPPDTTYLFACFPHGILSFGLTTNLLSDVNHFDKAFPGLDVFLMTVKENFYIPFAREIFMALGMCSVSAKGILRILNGPPGNVCAIIVGGIAEALKAVPGTYTLVLKKRKGFVRLAMKTGSPIVPVFSFGENDSYGQIINEWSIWIQRKLRTTIRMPFLVPKGKGFFEDGLGLIPYNHPITTVVGKPIKVPKIENPSQDLIDTYHEMYMKELTDLFNKYKGKYDLNGANAILSIE